MIKIEMKKALGNIMFIATLIVATAVAVYSAAYVIVTVYNYAVENDALSESIFGDTTNPDHAMITLFNQWMGQEWNSMGQSLFYLLLPFFGSLAYSWSLLSERKSGYIKHIVTRTLRRKYYTAKYIAVFVAGGLVVLIPLIINFMVVSAFIPATTPDIFYDIYYDMGPTKALSQLFFSHPYVFVLYRMISAFIFAGLFASLGMSFSFFIKNRFVIVALPFLISMLLNYIDSSGYFKYLISPSLFLHNGGAALPTSAWLMLAEILIMFALSFGITVVKGKKDDVF
ncbi:MAG: hypothetical protein LUG85_00550 [Clostridiales bacterium]|nr:hypothetical protein [Clostridiales bacterium]